MEKQYSFAEAQREASLMQDKVESGEAKNYPEAEGLAEHAIKIGVEDYYKRVLPLNHIPSDEQVEVARKHGVELKTVFYNASNSSVLFLDAQIGQALREEYKNARKEFTGEERESALKKAREEALATIFESVPQERKGDFQNGVLEIRLMTFCKNPKTCPRPKEYFAGTEIPNESPIVTAADLIDFSKIDWEKLLKERKTPIVTTQESKPQTFQPAEETPRDREKKIPSEETVPFDLINRLQKFRLKMGKALQSGKPEDWDDLVDEYIELMDNMPQYIEHRLAVIDLLQRVRSEEITKIPSKILSVASGPHLSARAEMDFEFLYKKYGLEKPEIFNIDFSLKMLQKSEATYEEKAVTDGKEDYWNIPQNIVGDMRALPIRDGSFEMVECSSLDNLLKRAPEDVVKTLKEMVRALKVGGLLRISHKEQLSDDFFDTLRSLGLKLITAPHTTYAADNELLRDMENEQGGASVANRLKQKINRNAEYILAVKNERTPIKEPPLVRSDVALVAPRPETSAVDAMRLKQSLESFLTLEGHSKLFHENKRRKTKVPFKKFRRDIIHATVKSLIEEADNNLAVVHGVPYSIKDKLAHFANYISESQKPLVPLDEVGLLDRPYREELVRTYAPTIYQELEAEGVVYGITAP